MIVLFYCFLIVNVIAFILIGYDKYLAKAKKRRVSEKTLLALVLIGGTIGSGLAMLFFRHKTAKRSYLMKFWGIILLQIVVFYFLYRYDFIVIKR
ncbi:DUF1294 domain-containing protein [Flavobacterium hiemivividum]|uniref:DUF1294 domain-containing protein n=1 Tax=Flavobacterium hiemivividum TaxID=2541734 RepID=A0A4R5D0R9_9FLAO|nr:DUF1294 domain-containing protein [Flavobacterium hiemivividum]TDE06799.1 DUF1294 domain-containing protein [Flavobacterium hiemivividum]